MGGPEALDAPLAPKAAALALQAAAGALGWGSEWLLAFSSSSSLLGYGGQANYCAANTLLDHAARWPAPLACAPTAVAAAAPPPIVAVNWGPWGEVGMAAAGSKAHAQALRGGELPLPTALALRALGTLLEHARAQLDGGKATDGDGARALPPALRQPQFAVIAAEWARSVWAELPTVRALLDGAAARPAGVGGGGDGDELEDGEGEEDTDAGGIGGGAQTGVGAAGDGGGDSRAHAGEIGAFLARHVPAEPNPARTLVELGLDSLDVVQMRTQFQKEFQVAVPLSAFTAANVTLGGLVAALRLALDAGAQPSGK
ncbi:hypothetical protein T492DRAFT_1006546 [Pavlovales sp. CCMP2436]|nr:hypothetical protein T492DRAFT_1006546 [Pavlovales sp. CCMP2436]